MSKSDQNQQIRVIGARTHNLKNITVSIPKNKFTVITGPSGSGKSSLAFDVLFAEGQRRYLESMSLYARQFLGIPPKADCDRIEGLCPAIAIDQKTVGANPRSTVGTITEINDYLRVLFARIGTTVCPRCNVPVKACTIAYIEELVHAQFAGQTIAVHAPCIQRKKGTMVPELTDLVAQGVHNFIIDGKPVKLYTTRDIEQLTLAKTMYHTIDGVIDTVEVLPHDQDERVRLHEAIERACRTGNGACLIVSNKTVHPFSTKQMCVSCGHSFPELEPRMFSFNSPLGACSQCQGLGVVIPTYNSWGAVTGYTTTCPSCLGKRLSPDALAVFVGGKNIFDIGNLPISDCARFCKDLTLPAHEHEIAKGLLEEITRRLQFLENVGLGYLSLNRDARTLSGGEGQRIRLARQLGSALSGILYILDEPSIGLHMRDNDRLIATLKGLRDLGNTVIVVEHDHETMNQADYLIDMGPAAGIHGGAIVAAGTPDDIKNHPDSITGAFLSHRLSITRQKPLREPQGFFTLKNISVNNISNLSVSFPMGVLCCVSGVSGSGKSSLIMDCLVPRLLVRGSERFDEYTRCITGAESIENVVVIDQSPIGRTPRSNPATYIGIFDDIRRMFAGLPESNARGYTPGHFSFNVRGGRCDTCCGEGTITVCMQLLPDVITACPDCGGRRFSNQTLEVRFKNKSIYDILEMTAREALEFFAHHRAIAKRLQLLCDVGLEYLTLGQSSTTLSGGEAQRIKLVTELAKRGCKTLYVLDEPTTGLHVADIEKLLYVFHRLIEQGNTVLVIEHNIDVLKVADYVIDMGPEGGTQGGQIVAVGTPADIAKCQQSHTGRYLRQVV